MRIGELLLDFTGLAKSHAKTDEQLRFLNGIRKLLLELCLSSLERHSNAQLQAPCLRILEQLTGLQAQRGDEGKDQELPPLPKAIPDMSTIVCFDALEAQQAVDGLR